MNRYEKIAWFNLTVILVSVVLFLAVFFIFRTSYPLNRSLKISFAAFALVGFIGLGPTLFKKKPGGQDSEINDDSDGHDTLRYDAELDERDILIQRRAALQGFSAFWIILVFSVMIVWVFLRFISPDGTGAGPISVTIDVDLFPLMLFPGFIILMLASSLSTIIQYRSIAFGDNIYETGAGPGRKTIVYTFVFSLSFIALNIFMVSHADWMFAVKFLMLIFASVHLTIRSLRYNPSGNYNEGDLRVLKIAEWTASSLFIVFYLASIVSIVIQYMESGTISVIVPRLFILGFGTLIFVLSILKYGNKHHMEHRHE